MNYLLDTCVISELVAKQPNSNVVQWIDSVDDQRLFLCTITIGEIKRGIEKLPETRRRTLLNDWLVDDLLVRFANRILPLDTSILLSWGAFTARLEARGRKLPAMDSLIAAVVIHHGLHLVTRNERDFIDAGVQVVNPWRG